MKIVVSKRAEKALDRAPDQVKFKFTTWSEAVEKRGIREVRKIKSFHDEPLQGDRKGQRSIRLNIQWRAIYIEEIGGEIELIKVEEISPHEYKK